jgi:DedD protein
MRSLLDTEEQESKASEITLSTASLLGIFFGLVLICGVFFGFGYSMGRGTGGGTPAAKAVGAPATAATEPDDTTVAENSLPASVAPPVVAQNDVPLPAKTARAKPDDSDNDVPDTPKVEVPRTPVKKPSAAQPAVLEPPATGGQPMVQIAAVARREDADVLVSALRQRGYGVVVRSEPQDKLLHVQVGPFADRVQAAAIKQKLLSDGYNAIIKQ